jgi:hypothetical protein
MAIHQRLHVVLPLVYQIRKTCQEFTRRGLNRQIPYGINLLDFAVLLTIQRPHGEV